MSTTIQIKEDTKLALERLKLFERETYNDVLERLLEDLAELGAETKKEIEAARKAISKGEYITHEDLKKEMGF